MATYQILYWRDIPSQVKAVDDEDEVNLPMKGAFMAKIDAAALKLGLQNADDYLAQWRWSEAQERPGSAQDVADAVMRELAAGNET